MASWRAAVSTIRLVVCRLLKATPCKTLARCSLVASSFLTLVYNNTWLATIKLAMTVPTIVINIYFFMPAKRMSVI